MAKHLVTRSWLITQGLPLDLHKLTEGTVSTDLLVAYTPFFLDPKYMGKRERGPRHKPGLWPTQKRARSCARNPTLTGFLERTQNLRCADLPLSGFVESAQSLACALIRRTFYALERRTTHSSEWDGTQTLRREQQAHRWPSYGEGSNAGSTNKASDLSQSSGGRRNSDAQKGAACS